MENCANFNVSSHLLGRCIWVLFSAYRLALFAPSHLLYRTTSWLPIFRGVKLIPFPSQPEKQTQTALLILKMIYLKLYRAVSFLQTYNYSRKIRGQFSTRKNKIITIHSLARNFFHLTRLKKNYLHDLIDRRTITNP